MSFKIILIAIVSLLFFSCRSSYNDKKAQEEFNQRGQESLIDVNRQMVKRDSEKIVGYIRAKKWDMKVTGTGLWYEIVEKGHGSKPKVGDVVSFDYKVRLMNGQLCYTSDSTGPMRFRLSQGGVERGLEEGVLLLREGDSARFILPQYMAHHLLGDMDKIPPLSTIIYEVRLKSVQN